MPSTATVLRRSQPSSARAVARDLTEPACWPSTRHTRLNSCAGRVAMLRWRSDRSATVADNPLTPAESDATEPTQSDTALAQRGRPDAARLAQPGQRADAPPLMTL